MASENAPGRRPSMFDVARLAGVSHQTVSRVLNDSPAVAEATRRRVADAIAAVGYRRNQAARQLATARSRIIGLITPRTSLYGPSRSTLAIEAAARERGYWVSLVSLPQATAQAMADALGHFLELAVDAVAVIAPNPAVLHALAAAPDLPPAVAVTSGPALPGVTVADADQALGARLATERLIGLGRRRIAHIAGPADFYHARVRAEVWARTLAEHGLAADRQADGDWSGPSGRAAAAQLLAAGSPAPDAIFAGNDLMAMGAIAAVKRAGLKVPDDVAVVGFDDVPGADVADPPLTTVDPDHGSLGRAVVELLDRRLNAGDAAWSGTAASAALAPPRLVVRESA
ncbi:MAG: LacI family transcriptional regulator [Bifidobacteriaceae bacterium]|jgi:DNA-binding LacI/PurR family transcriptional regulator|nr:LacI family transcriptional regulator [Bifidobacteriaceae bacterium]